MEFAHIMNGVVCYFSPFCVRYKHDFSLFLENLPIYKMFLKKQGKKEEYWQKMADKAIKVQMLIFHQSPQKRK